jgi:hypothetical protein
LESKHFRTIHLKATRTFPRGYVEQVSASVSPAVQVGEHEWHATVTCPFLFTVPKAIVGGDAAQAQELGEKFLRLMLEDFEVYED